MKKGFGPIAIAFVAILVALFIEAILLVNAVYRIQSDVVTVREASIIKSINDVEFIKRSLPSSLDNSFYQASYDVANRGGYSVLLSTVPSYNCIPYLRIYDSSTNFPDYVKSIEDTTLKNMNTYVSNLYDSANINYNKISLTGNALEVESDNKLVYTGEELKIEDNASVIRLVDTGFLRVFDIAKQNFIDQDKIGDSVKDAVKNYNCGDSEDTISNSISSKLSELSSSLNSQYSAQNIAFEISAEDQQFSPSCNSNVGVRVLTKIIDGKSSHLVYDGIEKTTKERNIQIKFYTLSGNYAIQPITNPCA